MGGIDLPEFGGDVGQVQGGEDGALSLHQVSCLVVSAPVDDPFGKLRVALRHSKGDGGGGSWAADALGAFLGGNFYARWRAGS